MVCNIELYDKRVVNNDIYVIWIVLKDIEGGAEMCYDYADGEEAFVALYDEVGEASDYKTAEWECVLAKRLASKEGDCMARIKLPKDIEDAEVQMVTHRSSLAKLQAEQEQKEMIDEKVKKGQKQCKALKSQLALAQSLLRTNEEEAAQLRDVSKIVGRARLGLCDCSKKYEDML